MLEKPTFSTSRISMSVIIREHPFRLRVSQLLESSDGVRSMIQEQDILRLRYLNFVNGTVSGIQCQGKPTSREYSVNRQVFVRLVLLLVQSIRGTIPERTGVAPTVRTSAIICRR